MKKVIKLINLTLTMLLVFAFAGCGSTETPRDGKSSYEIWLDNGHDGTEADFLEWLKGGSGNDGEEGAIGKSAYKIWLDNGHDGTEADFLEWLKGDPGLSAYEIYLKYHPEYEGDEEQWMDDLVNGRLKNEFMVADPQSYFFKMTGNLVNLPDKELISSRQELEKYRGNLFFGADSESAEIFDGYADSYFESCQLLALRLSTSGGYERLEIRKIEYQNDAFIVYIDRIQDGGTGSGIIATWFTLIELDTIYSADTKIIATHTNNAVHYDKKQGLAYRLINDGTAYEVYRYLSDATKLVIPAKYLGLPITGIGQNAFGECIWLTDITIPQSITDIGDSAFVGCTGLENIVIPKNVTEIGQFAFFGCTGLKNIVFAAGSKLIHIGNNTFDNCREVKSIDLPSSITTIGRSGFNGWSIFQTICVEGFASQEQADAAWGSGWRSGCQALIVYLG